MDRTVEAAFASIVLALMAVSNELKDLGADGSLNAHELDKQILTLSTIVKASTTK